MEATTSKDELKIALAFSGGGYRAACFSLGTLSYLNSLKIGNKTLLDFVTVLSTVSGGTITGAAYAIGMKEKKEFPFIYKKLYHFMKNTDMVGDSLRRLQSDDGWDEVRIRSLINSFADIYNDKLFDKATFGDLMKDNPAIHLKHISFNATEFSTASQFRFQWSEKINNPRPGEPVRGIIGNGNINVPESAAADIRMADVLAASSCFPGGFEPINFPQDFIHSKKSSLNSIASDDFPVGLMDGGIVDNQGIEPVLLAEKRMKRNHTNTTKTDNELDLVIIADVASPYMEGYKASIQHPAKGWRRLTLGGILLTNLAVLLTALYGVYWSFVQGSKWTLIISTVITTISVVVFVMGRLLRKLPQKFSVPSLFLKPLGILLKLKLQVFENLIINRKNSVIKMVSEVSLKRFRGMHYRDLYEDKSWENRRIMNAIYELREGEESLIEKIKSGKLDRNMMPSPGLSKVAGLAASMGTTLWFTEEELIKKKMMEVIIACGRFTTCWNLLEYIAKAKKSGINLTPNHQLIFDLEEKLKSDWKDFNDNPYFEMSAE